jgi:YHS domain-containing protein
MKVVDPVCKMTIEDRDAVATSIYKGITYHFCSKAYKEDFDKNPESFVSVISPIPPLIKGGEGGLLGFIAVADMELSSLSVVTNSALLKGVRI